MQLSPRWELSCIRFCLISTPETINFPSSIADFSFLPALPGDKPEADFGTIVHHDIHRWWSLMVRPVQKQNMDDELSFGERLDFFFFFQVKYQSYNLVSNLLNKNLKSWRVERGCWLVWHWINMFWGCACAASNTTN